MFSLVWLFVAPRPVGRPAPLSMGFSRPVYWSGLPFPSPGDLPNSGIKPGSPALQADSLPPEPPGGPYSYLFQPILKFLLYNLCNHFKFQDCFLIFIFHFFEGDVCSQFLRTIIRIIWIFSVCFPVFVLISFYWSILALQCRVSFYCTAEWISCAYINALSFLNFLSI